MHRLYSPAYITITLHCIALSCSIHCVALGCVVLCVVLRYVVCCVTLHNWHTILMHSYVEYMDMHISEAKDLQSCQAVASQRHHVLCRCSAAPASWGACVPVGRLARPICSYYRTPDGDAGWAQTKHEYASIRTIHDTHMHMHWLYIHKWGTHTFRTLHLLHVLSTVVCIHFQHCLYHLLCIWLHCVYYTTLHALHRIGFHSPIWCMTCIPLGYIALYCISRLAWHNVALHTFKLMSCMCIMYC